MTRFRLANYAVVILCMHAAFASTAQDTSLPAVTEDQLARVDISPESLNLGTVRIDTVTKKWVRVENTGSVTIIVDAVSTNRDEFQLACPPSSYLAPGSTLSCNVAFIPRFDGQYSGTVVLHYRWREDTWAQSSGAIYRDSNRHLLSREMHRDNNWHWSLRAIHVVALAERSTANISANPSSINFGALQLSQRKIVTQKLTNNSRAALTISRIVATGRDFSFNGIETPVTLTPGQSFSFSVIYSPVVGGQSTGAIFIESSASNSGVSIGLSGTAVVPGRLRLSTTALNFGNVVVGSAQKQVATLYAEGGPVLLSSAHTNNAEFTTAGMLLPMMIPSGGTASMTLTFSPQTSGTSTGLLSLISNATNSGVNVPIAGVGTPRLQHSVTLSWDSSGTDDIVGYNLYRSTRSGGPFARVNLEVNSSTSETDDTVSPGQTYYYVVTAVGSNSLESGYSNEVSAVIPSP